MYLSSRGYVLLKSQFTNTEIQSIKDDLTISPKENRAIRIAKQVEIKIVVFKENEQKLYIPRFYGIQKYGLPMRAELSAGDTIDVPFQNELREYQKDIVNIYLNHVKTGQGGGILEVPCGRGKTIMGLNILSQLKKKTLIIVHKEFLLNQWMERIADFLPSARVGKIQGNISKHFIRIKRESNITK